MLFSMQMSNRADGVIFLAAKYRAICKRCLVLVAIGETIAWRNKMVWHEACVPGDGEINERKIRAQEGRFKW